MRPVLSEVTQVHGVKQPDGTWSVSLTVRTGHVATGKGDEFSDAFKNAMGRPLSTRPWQDKKDPA